MFAILDLARYGISDGLRAAGRLLCQKAQLLTGEAVDALEPFLIQDLADVA